MNKKGLSDKQFLIICIIIIICGIGIVGRDYFLMKKAGVYEEMSILLSDHPGLAEEETSDTTVVTTTGDTSGRVEKETGVTYNYAGRLKIPSIGLNRGFLKYGQSGNNVDQNVAVMKGSTYPTDKYSHLILAAHNGSGWNAFFTKIDQLKLNSLAYITYEGKEYKYKLVRIGQDRQSDGGITLYRNSSKKHLTLVTCKRPDYRTYYLVLTFELVEEYNI